MQLDHQPEWVQAYRRAVGERIRLRRVHQNLTQISLCYICGVDRSTYQRWEYGTSDPSLGELALLAQALDTTVPALTDVPLPPR